MKPTEAPGIGNGRYFAAYTATFAVAVCVSITMLRPHLPSMLEMDSLGYYKSAINMMRHGVFSEAGAPNLHPISFRTPGYPFLLAALFRLTGPGVLAPAVLNAAFLWSTGIATMVTARLLGAGPQRVLLAGLLVGISPLALFWSTQVYTDTLFVALLSGAIMLGVTGLVRECPKHLLASAFILGWLPIVRPVGLYVVAAALLLGFGLVLWRWRRDGIAPPRPRAIWITIAFIALAGTPTAAWMVRNKAQFGTFHFCEIGAWNLRFAHMNVVLARTEGADFGVLFADSFKATYPQIYRPGKSPGLLAQEWTREAIGIARRHPGMTIRVALENLKPLMSPSVSDWRRGLGQEGSSGLVGRVAGLIEWVLVLAVTAAAAYNLLSRWRHAQQRGIVTVLMGVSILLIAVSLPVGNMTAPRFRLPFWPLMVLIAAAGPSGATGRTADHRRAAPPEEATESCSAM